MIEVVITTYERPDALGRLLDDIDACRTESHLHVHVYDDASKADYSAVRERIERRGWAFTRAPEHYGREGFWRWCGAIHAERRFSPAALFFMMADDMRLCRDFFNRAIDVWSAIDDPQKIALNVFKDRRALARQWVSFEPRPSDHVIETGWADGMFLCERRYFEALDWDAPIVPPGWLSNPDRSTGVHCYIARRMEALGCRTYCVSRSLSEHEGDDSVMHPGLRQREPIRAIDYIDDDHGFASDAT